MKSSLKTSVKFVLGFVGFAFIVSAQNCGKFQATKTEVGSLYPGVQLLAISPGTRNSIWITNVVQEGGKRFTTQSVFLNMNNPSAVELANRLGKVWRDAKVGALGNGNSMATAIKVAARKTASALYKFEGPESMKALLEGALMIDAAENVAAKAAGCQSCMAFLYVAADLNGDKLTPYSSYASNAASGLEGPHAVLLDDVGGTKISSNWGPGAVEEQASLALHQKSVVTEIPPGQVDDFVRAAAGKSGPEALAIQEVSHTMFTEVREGLTNSLAFEERAEAMTLKAATVDRSRRVVTSGSMTLSTSRDIISKNLAALKSKTARFLTSLGPAFRVLEIGGYVDLVELAFVNIISPGSGRNFDALMEELKSSVGDSICLANPTFPLCASHVDPRKVLVTSGWAWQFNDAANSNIIWSAFNDGSYTSYNQADRSMTGVLVKPEASAAGLREFIDFVATPMTNCPFYIVKKKDSAGNPLPPDQYARLISSEGRPASLELLGAIQTGTTNTPQCPSPPTTSSTVPPTITCSSPKVPSPDGRSCVCSSNPNLKDGDACSGGASQTGIWNAGTCTCAASSTRISCFEGPDRNGECCAANQKLVCSPGECHSCPTNFVWECGGSQPGCYCKAESCCTEPGYNWNPVKNQCEAISSSVNFLGPENPPDRTTYAQCMESCSGAPYAAHNNSFVDWMLDVAKSDLQIGPLIVVAHADMASTYLPPTATFSTTVTAQADGPRVTVPLVCDYSTIPGSLEQAVSDGTVPGGIPRGAFKYIIPGTGGNVGQCAQIESPRASTPFVQAPNCYMVTYNCSYDFQSKSTFSTYNLIYAPDDSCPRPPPPCSDGKQPSLLSVNHPNFGQPDRVPGGTNYCRYYFSKCESEPPKYFKAEGPAVVQGQAVSTCPANSDQTRKSQEFCAANICAKYQALDPKNPNRSAVTSSLKPAPFLLKATIPPSRYPVVPAGALPATSSSTTTSTTQAQSTTTTQPYNPPPVTDVQIIRAMLAKIPVSAEQITALNWPPAMWSTWSTKYYEVTQRTAKTMQQAGINLNPDNATKIIDVNDWYQCAVTGASCIVAKSIFEAASPITPPVDNPNCKMKKLVSNGSANNSNAAEVKSIVLTRTGSNIDLYFAQTEPENCRPIVQFAPDSFVSASRSGTNGTI
ncbi:MAG: hypothetical protein K2X47_19625, partial [Bdellovibrionales bacterium]|nr:hypothetical protein [Bdellovibrionales bacterium]